MHIPQVQSEQIYLQKIRSTPRDNEKRHAYPRLDVFTTLLGPHQVESLEMRGPDGPHPAKAWVDILVHVDLAELRIQSNWYSIGIHIRNIPKRQI